MSGYPDICQVANFQHSNMNKRPKKPTPRRDDGVPDRGRSYGQTVGESADSHELNPSYVDNYTRIGGSGLMEKRSDRATMGRSSDRANGGSSGNRSQAMSSAENLDLHWRSSPKPEMTPGLNRDRGPIEGGSRNNSHMMRSKNGVLRDNISRSYGNEGDRNWNIENNRYRDMDANDVAAKYSNDSYAMSQTSKADPLIAKSSSEEFNVKIFIDWHTHRYEAIVRSHKIPSSDIKFGNSASDVRYYETKTTGVQPPIAPAKEDIILMLERAVTQWNVSHSSSAARGVIPLDSSVGNRPSSHHRGLSEPFKAESPPTPGISHPVTSPRMHHFVLSSEALSSSAGASLHSGKLTPAVSRSQSNQRMAASMPSHTVPQAHTGSVLRNDTYSSSPAMHVIDNSRSASTVQTKHSSTALLSKQLRNEMLPY